MGRGREVLAQHSAQTEVGSPLPSVLEQVKGEWDRARQETACSLRLWVS